MSLFSCGPAFFFLLEAVMPDPSSLPPTLPTLAPLLLLAFAAGSFTQLTRLLARPGRLRLRPTAAQALAAGVAALTVVALLSLAFPAPAPAALLAAACVTGWSGPAILGRLSALTERQLGLRLPPERDNQG
ncbi:hypothetical protein K7W42_06475 [Deinococcus sp. HMF7604]|uniref:hypothetical protein n=1 Tax=Deinococcus betulae TaxID=2873312 RepID=UPI001CC916C2|nr:hypothetical protein [Deinococcus betulae]MBZ9750502.1 hypothetical protein [Deinococcus betulae]